MKKEPDTCIVVLKGQVKIESDEDCQGEEVELNGINDKRTSHSSIKSPPMSPKSKAMITVYTSKCSDAVKRLREFVGIQDDSTSDFDDPR